ncbi:MAG: CRTAC1 family protein [Planctomycetales bacterium]|nr:CRTAC1 family protein [Planctomycetales bacterium]
MSKLEQPEKYESEELVAQDDAVIGRALKVSLVIILFGVAIACGVIFWISRPETPEAPVIPKLGVVKPRKESDGVMPEVKFTDITSAAGIKFKHCTGGYGEKLLPETMGSGAAFFDYDNDGDQDLLLVNSCYWPWKRPKGTEKDIPTSALYQNDGKGKFTDVTKEAGLDLTCYGMGVAVGDYDSDGWLDVFISAVGQNHLMKNDHGKFTDVAAAAGVAGVPQQWSTSCGFVDYNNDGLLDLFVCNYIKWSREIDQALGSTLDGENRAFAPPVPFEGAFCYLYRNEGEGKFKDVSAEMGIQVRNVNTKVPVGKSLGVSFADLDRDGFMDIIVANDTVQNFLFHNLKGEKFEEIGQKSGIAYGPDGQARGAMGSDVAAFRPNGTYGILIGNFANEPTSLFATQDIRNPLSFSDEALPSGLGPQSRLELKFGVFFFDYDLDGRLDVLTANGHLEEDIAKVQKSQSYKQPPQIFWNAGEGDSEFMRVPGASLGPDFTALMVGRGSAYADIDGDGDLDFVLTGSGSAPRLLRNDQKLGHHWLRIQLKGKGKNTFAYGARVELVVDGAVQERLVSPTRGYLSQSEIPLTFGLGKHEKVEKVTIHWQDGSKQDIVSPTVDKLLAVEQDSK